MDEKQLDVTLGTPIVIEIPASRFAPATKVGDVVALLEAYGYSDPWPVGTKGEVIHIDEHDTVTIKVPNGELLTLIPHLDKWELA